jgi:hypothetical protein
MPVRNESSLTRLANGSLVSTHVIIYTSLDWVCQNRRINEMNEKTNGNGKINNTQRRVLSMLAVELLDKKNTECEG